MTDGDEETDEETDEDRHKEKERTDKDRCYTYLCLIAKA